MVGPFLPGTKSTSGRAASTGLCSVPFAGSRGRPCWPQQKPGELRALLHGPERLECTKIAACASWGVMPERMAARMGALVALEEVGDRARAHLVEWVADDGALWPSRVWPRLTSGVGLRACRAERRSPQ